MNPLPATDSEWLEDVRLAYADAAEALPLMPLLGQKRDPGALLTIAPNVCAKFRGLPGSGRKFDAASEASLVSYVANSEKNPGLFQAPQVAFAFCYVASHFGFDLLSKADAGRILDYLMEHADQLTTAVPSRPTPRPRLTQGNDTPQLAQLLQLTAEFCQSHLNPEYAELCAKLIQKAGRLRTPLFASGKIEGWAAGVVHALCTANFAFDKSQTPHLTARTIAEHFGVSLNTASEKSKALRDRFKIRHWDAEFSTQEMRQKRPMLGLW